MEQALFTILVCILFALCFAWIAIMALNSTLTLIEDRREAKRKEARELLDYQRAEEELALMKAKRAQLEGR